MHPGQDYYQGDIVYFSDDPFQRQGRRMLIFHLVRLLSVLSIVYSWFLPLH